MKIRRLLEIHEVNPEGSPIDVEIYIGLRQMLKARTIFLKTQVTDANRETVFASARAAYKAWRGDLTNNKEFLNEIEKMRAQRKSKPVLSDMATLAIQNLDPTDMSDHS